MEIDKDGFSGAHFDLIIEDDIQTEGCAGTLTEEQWNDWLRDALVVTSQNLNEQMFARGLAGSGVHTATEVALKEQSKKLARLLISEQRALKLLRRFITPSQWKDYNSLGYFSQKDGKGRLWKFKKEHHYPIECDGQPICIDPEEGTPDADLLLQVWLEVIGGRGEEILPTTQIGQHFSTIICDDLLDATAYMIDATSSRHGILQGIT